MNLWREEPDYILVECEKCGKVLKFNKKYFDKINTDWKPNALLQCPCGNSTQLILTNNTIEKNVPKCPTCGSTNIKRISGLSKAGSFAMFGVFSLGKVSKTFECKNCHYKW